MADKQERRERQRRFAALSGADRRVIVRSVNRGQPVEHRKHAEHAVHIARRQMRFWSVSWLIGPVVGIAQIAQLGWQVAVLNAAVAALALGAMSLFFHRRARRALDANVALLSRRDATRLGEGESERSRARDTHLPRAGAREESADGESSPRPSTAARRPYQPRGRKRRGKS